MSVHPMAANEEEPMDRLPKRLHKETLAHCPCQISSDATKNLGAGESLQENWLPDRDQRTPCELGTPSKDAHALCFHDNAKGWNVDIMLQTKQSEPPGSVQRKPQSLGTETSQKQETLLDTKTPGEAIGEAGSIPLQAPLQHDSTRLKYNRSDSVLRCLERMSHRTGICNCSLRSHHPWGIHVVPLKAHDKETGAKADELLRFFSLTRKGGRG